MTTSKSDTLRLLNEHYEIIWTIVNADDSMLEDQERENLNAALEQVLESIKRIQPLKN